MQTTRGTTRPSGLSAAAATASTSSAHPQADPTSRPAGDDAWKREFAASPALQKEFTTEARYVAFRRAETAGRARVIGRRAQ